MNLPLGYRYSAVYAGIRAAQKDDLALIVSGMPANAAAVFTQNRVQAAPVRLSRRNLKAGKGLVGAVLINAGNANCATRTGDAVAAATSRAAAKALRLPAAQVLPASTGVIGVELDASKIVGALPGLIEGLSLDRFDDAARAIMTTDLVPKTASAEVKLRRGTVRVAGMTKGSGMIQPMMATTLGFVLTDAQVPLPALRAILKRSVERSYNRISVDGDTSTNDTLLLLANGASGVRPDPAPRRTRRRRGWPAPSPTRPWSRPPWPAATRIGDECCRPPGIPGWPSIQPGPIFTCRACWSAAAGSPRRSTKPDSRRGSTRRIARSG
jgi:glutamate N-acetyltransferase/amino-acid N-acetyltransferase